MRLALLSLAVSVACGGSRHTSGHAGAREPVFPEYAATRWIPAKPSYVVAARSVADAQRGLRDLADSFGMFVGADARGVSQALERVLGVDPLSPDPVAGVGVDLNGGFAMFSEDINPTFVFHLAAPDQTQAFFAHQRERGMVTQSVAVEGAEIFTAHLGGDVAVSWVVADAWMWVHFSFPGLRDDPVAWFTSSRHANGPAVWSADFTWAQNAGGHSARSPNVVGYANLRDLVTGVARTNLGGCARLVEPVGRIAIAIDGDGKHAHGRFSLELAPDAAQALGRHVLPVPAGFAATASGAPLAAQWNVDLDSIAAWISPCVSAETLGLDYVLRFGVRSARVILRTFDVDATSGTGVVAFDLARSAFFAKQLDEIPFRSRLESARRFGPHDGRTLSIPFGPKIDYILTDKLAMAGLGDGLLERVVGRGGAQPGPLVELDLAPPALKPKAWEWLLGKLGAPQARWLADQLEHWHDGHIVVSIDGTQLILDAFGDRR